MYTSLVPFAFDAMVKANGVFFIVLPSANEMDSGGVVVGVTGVDTVDGSRTAVAGDADVLYVGGVLFALIVEPHLSSTFVPRFSSSINVASFDSFFGGGCGGGLVLIIW